ncbi:MAG: LuxR C-terminal-related transcriptional regulator [Lentimicrobium sp.]|jgi:DNA-binding CsgD family transcriptional regulator|nr:LuxR C-terminal-related transcriptional regulator [Lentimicrobium sp.]MDD2527228.1 LuxR C-terminal-related transcriptional regulator [Lentimicrobiaceae bacterium]MDD4596593.1 LuxR C-terminal-related transcriptional regulator [Lentimicrobiaceae bacterium]MDY0024888.1 LuxR C-terminal-related transcriptional regulator [Lentimicrobium sp.]HAH57908.1 hypothetical protein [Bacteroidales bacterium]
MEPACTHSGLTSREKQILKLVVKENSTLEISDLLQISTRTVETHRKNINRKTKVKSLAGLTKVAIRMGLLEHFCYQPGSSRQRKAQERCKDCSSLD